MCILTAVLFFGIIGVLEARQPDIDINRVKYLPKEGSQVIYQPFNLHERRSIVANPFLRSNDYDDRSSGFDKPRAQIQLHDVTKTKVSSLKVHQPREDPRLFYQSDAYLQEINSKNINPEVSSIYPGREVIRAGEINGFRPLPIRLKDGVNNRIHAEDYSICVRCPHDRTLIAKTGSDRVMFQNPQILSCSGKKAPRNIRLVHMYGPKFGSLLEQGSHMVMGRIMYKNKALQLCKMQIHVVVQSCPVPKYLIPHCEDQQKRCNFTCRDPKTELHGASTLLCGENKKWNRDLPVCRARTWCESPPPPENGHISCQAAAVTNSKSGLAEGSRCRVRCASGWRPAPRVATVCRRGAWTHRLACQPKRNMVARN